MDIKRVVDDPEWQALRASFVGTWKHTPRANVQRLRAYLGDASDELRCRRVHNYLTGTAFRLGIIQHPQIDALVRRLRRRRA